MGNLQRVKRGVVVKVKQTVSIISINALNQQKKARSPQGARAEDILNIIHTQRVVYAREQI